MLDNSLAFFPVDEQPIFDITGSEIPNSKHIVRTDTGESLGVHSAKYKMIRHEDVFERINDAVKSLDISKDYDVNLFMADNGRKMRGELLFKDLTVQPSVGDYVSFRVSFFNSYDASWSFAANAEGLRLWCTNGCTTPDATTRSRFKHTQNVSIDGVASKVRVGLESFMQAPDLWRQWMNIPVDDVMAEAFFRSTLAKTYSRQQQSKTNERQLERLLSAWTAEKYLLGSNKWALYNACTYWASHTSESRSPETTRRNREDALSSALNHKAWEVIS